MTITVDLSRVLVRPGWAAGVCPIHHASHHCNQVCRLERYELAQIDADLWAFWAGLERMRRMVAA